MAVVTRKYKDNVFCMLYRDRKNLLSLYNAVNGTDYRDEGELEVVTLDFAICVSMRNDAAFLIDSGLNLYEQQSTPNPNMPLRDLYYIAEEFRRLVPMRGLYRNTRVKLPAPRFVTFYNGTAGQPAETTLRLSDLYEACAAKPDLELTVRQINIGGGENGELLEKCESLGGYMKFVGKVRVRTGAGMNVETAVTEAVDECIREGTLSEFFTRHRSEVIEVGIYEYDAEVHDEVLREESWELGRAAGRAEGRTEGRVEGRSEGRTEGRAEGRAEMIIEMLEELGTVPKRLRERIMAQSDPDILGKWGRLVMKADTVEDFERLLKSC